MIHLKSLAEIDRMRRSGEIVALLFEKLGTMIRPGITTADLDRMARETIRKHGAAPSFLGYGGNSEAGPFPAAICSSVNQEVIHGIPGNRCLEEGDIVGVDVGVLLDGYHADAARTFAVGMTGPVTARLLQVTKQCFFKGIEQAVPGNRIGDISAAIQEYAESNGFSVVRKYVGHGIGRDLHESPEVPNFYAGARGARLAAGMTLAVEPMVNEGTAEVRILDNGWTVVTADGKLSAHYENTIAVTKAEPMILTMM